MGNAGVPCARSSRLRAVPALRALRLRMRKVCWVAETMGARSIAGVPLLSTPFGAARRRSQPRSVGGLGGVSAPPSRLRPDGDGEGVARPGEGPDLRRLQRGLDAGRLAVRGGPAR